MSTHPYIPLYVDDYDAATAHLTPAEDGVYMRLMRLCWRTPGCSLPNDDAWIARKIRLTQAEFETIAKPVLSEFFHLVRGRLVQRRLKDEYDDISRKKSARAKAGKSGGLAKSRKSKENDPSNASDLPAHTRAFPEPDPYPEPNKELSVGPGPTEGGELELEQPEPAKPKGWQADEDFIAVWDGATDQMRKRSTRDKAWAAWRVATKSTPASLIRTAMPIYKMNDPDVGRTGGPGLHIWLKERKFEAHLNGQAAPAQAKAPAVHFEGPVELRRRVVALTSEDFAASWLDRCSWDAESRTLTAMGKIAAQRLEQELGGYFRQWRVTIAAPGNVVAFPGGQGAVA